MVDANSPLRPTPEQVRRAARDLKEAIDAHMFAVETRLGDEDPAVESAFDHLRHMGHLYDELMFQAHEEVTPFGEELPDPDDFGPSEEFPGDPGDMPPLVSLYLRRDYAVLDSQLLIQRGREAHEAIVGDNPDYDEAVPRNEPSSLFALYSLLRVDGFDALAEEAGLAPLGAVMWLMAAEAPVAFELDRPFSGVDERAEQHLIFRMLERAGDEEDEEDPQSFSSPETAKTPGSVGGDFPGSLPGGYGVPSAFGNLGTSQPGSGFDRGEPFDRFRPGHEFDP